MLCYDWTYTYCTSSKMQCEAEKTMIQILTCTIELEETKLSKVSWLLCVVAANCLLIVNRWSVTPAIEKEANITKTQYNY